MCQGRPATIVGTPEGRIVGTPGDDVIVSYGDGSLDAGDGDDLICLRPTLSLVQQVDAGAGDDSVVSEGETNHTFTDLGPGRDSFVGGGGEDRVSATFDDTVVADRGGDLVTYSLTRGEELPAVVGTIAAARDEGWIKVTAPGRRLPDRRRCGDRRRRRSGRHHVRRLTADALRRGPAGRAHGHVRVSTGSRRPPAARASSRGLGGNDEIAALGGNATPSRSAATGG